MPTRISAGVDDHPCFLTFYYYCMIPIAYKITKFSLHLFHINAPSNPSSLYGCHVKQNTCMHVISYGIVTHRSNRRTVNDFCP